jgi:hypothetical protein
MEVERELGKGVPLGDVLGIDLGGGGGVSGDRDYSGARVAAVGDPEVEGDGGGEGDEGLRGHGEGWVSG